MASPLAALLQSVRGCLDRFPDERRGDNVQYRIGDIGMAAFSAFFMQSPSFLAHQRLLEQGHGRSNCESLFGIAKIPSDNHIRTMLDKAAPALLDPARYPFHCSIETRFSDLDLNQHLCRAPGVARTPTDARMTTNITATTTQA